MVLLEYKNKWIVSCCVNYVNADTTGTKVGDAIEKRGLYRAREDNTAVASPSKGATNHPSTWYCYCYGSRMYWTCNRISIDQALLDSKSRLFTSLRRCRV